MNTPAPRSQLLSGAPPSAPRLSAHDRDLNGRSTMAGSFPFHAGGAPTISGPHWDGSGDTSRKLRDPPPSYVMHYLLRSPKATSLHEGRISQPVPCRAPRHLTARTRLGRCHFRAFSCHLPGGARTTSIFRHPSRGRHEPEAHGWAGKTELCERIEPSMALRYLGIHGIAATCPGVIGSSRPAMFLEGLARINGSKSMSLSSGGLMRFCQKPARPGARAQWSLRSSM